MEDEGIDSIVLSPVALEPRQRAGARAGHRLSEDTTSPPKNEDTKRRKGCREMGGPGDGGQTTELHENRTEHFGGWEFFLEDIGGQTNYQQN